MVDGGHNLKMLLYYRRWDEYEAVKRLQVERASVGAAQLQSEEMLGDGGSGAIIDGGGGVRDGGSDVTTYGDTGQRDKGRGGSGSSSSGRRQRGRGVTKADEGAEAAAERASNELAPKDSDGEGGAAQGGSGEKETTRQGLAPRGSGAGNVCESHIPTKIQCVFR